MPRNPGLPRNPRPTSARNTAIATGTTVTIGPTTGATTTMRRAGTAITVPAITAATALATMAAAPAETFALSAAAFSGGEEDGVHTERPGVARAFFVAFPHT